ncbi:hypothetical protein VNI00_017492 [Paramarasmius palmivorus]|uniref:Hydrophobin n=1 Tax=Paramarasmius palmivorus TaxID=297713 RepID=A0AAW0B4W2_9AGAR
MQPKLNFISLTALAALVAATPTRRAYSCTDDRTLLCCDAVAKTGDQDVVDILKGLGITVEDPNIGVGLRCTPIQVDGSCVTNALCCQDNIMAAMVALGCDPANGSP